MLLAKQYSRIHQSLGCRWCTHLVLISERLVVLVVLPAESFRLLLLNANLIRIIIRQLVEGPETRSVDVGYVGEEKACRCISRYVIRMNPRSTQECRRGCPSLHPIVFVPLPVTILVRLLIRNLK